MRQKSMSKNDPAERTVRDIRRKTRKQYTAEEKIRIVVSGLRNLSTTLRHRWFLFTDSFLLLWKWRVG